MRLRPYTERGVRRLRCFRCQRPKPELQWQICADGNQFRPICRPCDVALNEMVLTFMGDRDMDRKMKAYRKAAERGKTMTRSDDTRKERG